MVDQRVKWRYFVNIRTVDASGFVDLSHAINVRFTSVNSVYVYLSPF